MGEIDISKEAIEKDLALIKTCLRLINQAVVLRKRSGEKHKLTASGLYPNGSGFVTSYIEE